MQNVGITLLLPPLGARFCYRAAATPRSLVCLQAARLFAPSHTRARPYAEPRKLLLRRSKCPGVGGGVTSRRNHVTRRKAPPPLLLLLLLRLGGPAWRRVWGARLADGRSGHVLRAVSQPRTSPPPPRFVEPSWLWWGRGGEAVGIGLQRLRRRWRHTPPPHQVLGIRFCWWGKPL